MATTNKQDAQWIEVDVASLDEQTLKEYQGYKAQYQAMKDQRATFEAMLASKAGVPQGKRMIFGYNFGKLSVAIVEDDRKVKAKATPKLSLAAYMAQQAAR